jgi:hypothetical protein
MGGVVTAPGCTDRRGDLAMLALGRLDPEEATRVQAHVDGCATCTRALDELRRTAAALPLVDPDALRTVPDPPAHLADRILRQVREEQRFRRRRRTYVALAAAAVIAVLAGVVGVFATRDDGRTQREFAIEEPGVDASFSLDPNAEGTAVRLEHQGLDPGDVYWLWLTDESGQRVSAGTFHGSAERSSLVLQSAMPADQAVRIWVTDEDDGVVLDSPL